MIEELAKKVDAEFSKLIESHTVAVDELTVEVTPENCHQLCLALRDTKGFEFDMLIDLCGVDYSMHGISEWRTEETSATGFSRAVDRGHRDPEAQKWNKPRFAVVYHLLSVALNQRIRVKCFLDGEPPRVKSVIDIWNVADWFEREAFDLYGILFEGHPDLRRILTDYGFIGHPFRKDFPLIGKVEMRYDATLQRCVYEPVSIQQRINAPKTIRVDNRYNLEADEGANG